MVTTGTASSSTVTPSAASPHQRRRRRERDGRTYLIVPSAAIGSGLTNYTISYANGTLTVKR